MYETCPLSLFAKKATPESVCDACTIPSTTPDAVCTQKEAAHDAQLTALREEKDAALREEKAAHDAQLTTLREEKDAALREKEAAHDAQLTALREEKDAALREKEAAHDAQMRGADTYITSMLSQYFCRTVKNADACNSLDRCEWKSKASRTPVASSDTASKTSVSSVIASMGQGTEGSCVYSSSKFPDDQFEEMQDFMVQRFFDPMCARIGDCSAGEDCKLDAEGRCVFKR